MFVQIYFKKRTKSNPTYSDAETIRGQRIRIRGAYIPRVVILEERIKNKVTTHNYLVPPGYKWWETQYWIWQATEHTFEKERLDAYTSTYL